MAEGLDPYLQPNGTLKNLLGISDAELLARAEDQFTAVRGASLDLNLPDPPYTFQTLKDIHRHLFQDVYDWAGVPRSVALAKQVYAGAGGDVVRFTPPEQIESKARSIFASLARRRYLRGLSVERFADQAAYLFMEVNRLHPFREGNGRTQRGLLRAIAANAGHDLAFDVITRERMIAVSVAGCQGDYRPVRRLFEEILDPRRVAALRVALNFLKRHEQVPWNDLYIATTTAGQKYQGVVVGRAPPDFMMKVSAEPQDWIAIGDDGDLPANASSGDSITVVASKFGRR